MASILKKNTVFLLFLSIMMSIIAMAQNGSNLHIIKSGETLSALAVKYGTTVGDIMRLNGMDSKSQLKVGQAVKIPTTAKTIIEEPKKELVPQPLPPAKQPETSVEISDITYTVLKGQSLYGIAKKYNTTEEQLMVWNNLPNDKIRSEQVLIVGKATSEKSTTASTPELEVVKPLKKSVAIKTATLPSKNEDLTVLNSGSAKVTSPENTPHQRTKDIVTTIELAPIQSNAKYIDSEGYFATYFNRKEKLINTATGMAAVFKTTSGWTDKKYYVLLNDVAQGTIVRLTANNKSICAKVLGSLPNIKEDGGLLLRISNAAAAVLGIEDTKFDVSVNY